MRYSKAYLCDGRGCNTFIEVRVAPKGPLFFNLYLCAIFFYNFHLFRHERGDREKDKEKGERKDEMRG